MERTQTEIENPMLQDVARRIAAGLKRSSVATCSQWSCLYRKMGKPFPGDWSFDHHPWGRAMHDCRAELMVGQKAAQMGFTETALNKTFYEIDIKGNSVLYVLPASTPDASDFSKSRFDPALELSTHLTALFSNVKNIHLKRAGSANLFIRGSRSRSQMKSVPVSLIVFDEYDEMNQGNAALAEERVEGQREEDRQMYKISTPTLDNHGINIDYKISTQEHYFFRCPHCNRFIQLVYPDCLVIVGDNEADPRIRESHLICCECKAVLDHETKVDWLKDEVAGGTGVWVPEHSDRIVRGFQIPQFYSMTVNPYKLAIKVFKAETNPADEQELFNSKFGLTHTVEGAQINDADLDACIGDYTKSTAKRPGMITMGVDVGKWIHYEIDQYVMQRRTNDINLSMDCRILMEGKVQDFEELDQLMRDFAVRFCVIDANPERRKSLEFAQRFWGRVKCCFYGNNSVGKQVTVHPEPALTVTVDRTSWLDLSLGRFRNHTISVPKDLSTEYKGHIKSPVRIYEKDVNGNPVGRYVIGASENDHFAHARNYSEIALALGASLAQSQNMGETP